MTVKDGDRFPAGGAGEFYGLFFTGWYTIIIKLLTATDYYRNGGSLPGIPNGVNHMIKLYTDLGHISVSSDVLTELAGQAAMSCFGVKGMTVLSMTDGLVHLLKREAMGKGVKVVYNNDGTISIVLHIAVDEGVNIPVLCSNVRDEVRYKMENATGVSVKQVNVYVDSIIAG